MGWVIAIARLRLLVNPSTETSAAYQAESFSWAGEGERKASFLQVGQPLAFNIWFEEVGIGTAVNLANRMR